MKGKHAAPAFDELYERACSRKGGERALRALLTEPASTDKLRRLPSDRYLAELTRKIFQSGFVWRVVDQKWDNFEKLFWGFDVERLLMMPDDMLERKARDPAIIRNFTKVRTIRDNALMIDDTQRREGQSFGEFIAGWPGDDIVGLWLYLKKRGSRLGGNTGPFALRAIGVDTFLMTRDVEGFLRRQQIIEGGVGSNRSLLAAQAFFNALREESGYSLTALSRIVSFGFGKNHVGVAPGSAG